MKKKFFWLGMFFITVLVLVGCARTPKNEFVSFVKKDGKSSNINYDFTMKLTELELVSQDEEFSGSPLVKMFETQVKSSSAKGNIQSQTEKDKTKVSLDTTIDVAGTEIPLKLVAESGKEVKMYQSAETAASIVNLIGAFVGENSQIDKSRESKAKGKYIDFNDMDSTKEDKESLKESLELFDSPKKFNTNLFAWLSTLDKEKFEQKDELVTLKLTKKDIIQLIKDSSEKEDKEAKEMISTYQNEMKKFSMTHQINLKSGKQKVDIIVEPKEAELKEYGFKKMVLKIDFKKNQKDVSIALPKESDILSSKELDKILGDSDGHLLMPEEDSGDKKSEEKVNLKKFTPNPNDPDGDKEVSYKSDGDVIEAYVPDYSQYTQKDVKEMLGEPKVTLDDNKKVSEMLDRKEVDLIVAEFDAENLTESQGKAFVFATADLSMAVSMGTKVEVWVYEDDKPNVYFKEGKVVFVTPK
ncbi:MAG: DUF4947 domain-containing protein, partial [Vagococcus sp.]|uniref:DUF4947 domain-containing protein n=1 Tax=Vagococcus sp. TaxID=1933889 RepID=UPI002FC85A80